MLYKLKLLYTFESFIYDIFYFSYALSSFTSFRYFIPQQGGGILISEALYMALIECRLDFMHLFMKEYDL